MSAHWFGQTNWSGWNAWHEPAAKSWQSHGYREYCQDGWHSYAADSGTWLSGEWASRSAWSSSTAASASGACGDAAGDGHGGSGGSSGRWSEGCSGWSPASNWQSSWSAEPCDTYAVPYRSSRGRSAPPPHCWQHNRELGSIAADCQTAVSRCASQDAVSKLVELVGVLVAQAGIMRSASVQMRGPYRFARQHSEAAPGCRRRDSGFSTAGQRRCEVAGMDEEADARPPRDSAAPSCKQEMTPRSAKEVLQRCRLDEAWAASCQENWDWPLSKAEMKTRVHLIDQHLHRIELEELRK